jgi:hypothetical protein
MGKTRIATWALTFALAASVGIAGGVFASASNDAGTRAASAEAKEHCKPLLEKAKKKKGKAREKAMAKYRRCLENYVPTTTTTTTTDGGTTTTPTDGGGATQCTSLSSCPGFTRDDAAAQAAIGGDLFLEKSSFGSVSASYKRIFLYANGAVNLYEIDWTSASGEVCSKTQRGTWTFAEGYSYNRNGSSGVAALINVNFGGSSGKEILDFRNGDSAVYVGPSGERFERNPNMRDSC